MSFASTRERDEKGVFVKPSKPSSFDKKSYFRAYYQKNKEKKRLQTLEWTRNNKEKRKIIKDRWRAKNRERTNFLTRQYAYLKKNAIGSHSLEEIRKLYSINPTCPYYGVRKSNSIDHISPLSKGGSNDYKNLIACCVNCNSSKKSKTLWEWKPEIALNLWRFTSF